MRIIKFKTKRFISFYHLNITMRKRGKGGKKGFTSQQLKMKINIILKGMKNQQGEYEKREEPYEHVKLNSGTSLMQKVKFKEATQIYANPNYVNLNKKQNTNTTTKKGPTISK